MKKKGQIFYVLIYDWASSSGKDISKFYFNETKKFWFLLMFIEHLVVKYDTGLKEEAFALRSFGFYWTWHIGDQATRVKTGNVSDASCLVQSVCAVPFSSSHFCASELTAAVSDNFVLYWQLAVFPASTSPSTRLFTVPQLAVSPIIYFNICNNSDAMQYAESEVTESGTYEVMTCACSYHMLVIASYITVYVRVSHIFCIIGKCSSLVYCFSLPSYLLTLTRKLIHSDLNITRYRTLSTKKQNHIYLLAKWKLVCLHS
jgi:hypothetical protein